MQDRAIMEDLLLLCKGVCDLYFHGTIESGGEVRKTFCRALNENLVMQDEIYQKMSARGWYKADQASRSEIEAVRNSFMQSAGV